MGFIKISTVHTKTQHMIRQKGSLHFSIPFHEDAKKQLADNDLSSHCSQDKQWPSEY